MEKSMANELQKKVRAVQMQFRALTVWNKSLLVFFVGISVIFTVDALAVMYPNGASGGELIELLMRTYDLTNEGKLKTLDNSTPEGQVCINCFGGGADPRAQNRSSMGTFAGTVIAINDLWNEAVKADQGKVILSGSNITDIRGVCWSGSGDTVPCNSLKGKDPRRLIDPEKEGIGSLGLVKVVNDGKVGYGTGFLISKCHVLTNAHVVTLSAGNSAGYLASLTEERAKSAAIEFFNGRKTGRDYEQYANAARVKDVVGGINYSRDKSKDFLNRNEDFGVLRLSNSELGEKTKPVVLVDGFDFETPGLPRASTMTDQKRKDLPNLKTILDASKMQVFVASVGDTGVPTLQECKIVKQKNTSGNKKLDGWITLNDGLMNLNCSIAHGGSGSLIYTKYNNQVIPLGLAVQESRDNAIGAAVKVFSQGFVEDLMDVVAAKPCD